MVFGLIASLFDDHSQAAPPPAKSDNGTPPPTQRKHRRMGGGGAVTGTALTRALLAKKLIENYYDDARIERKQVNLRLSGTLGEEARKSVVAEEVQAMKNRRRVLTIHDFEEIALLGRGSFGEVLLVRKIDDRDSDGRGSTETGRNLYALKKIAKSETVKGDRLGRVIAERKMLVSADNDWFCKLHYAFHDDKYFYLVMEFLPGGDLLGMLIRDDVLPEEVARFYIAELVVAVDAMHKMGFIHRDVKPDNILFDSTGHLKLSDFGLCKALADENYDCGRVVEEDGDDEQPSFTKFNRMSSLQRRAAWKDEARKKNFTSVGTPNYVSYEVLLNSSYGEETDWWSVGAVVYEMLVGYPPFHADSAEETCKKIANYRKHLRFPRSRPLSPEAEDLIRRLLCPPECRLGARDGAEEFKKHPFFEGIVWETLREQTPYFVPDAEAFVDLRYFDGGTVLPGLARNDSSISSFGSSAWSGSSESDDGSKLVRKPTRTSMRRLGNPIEEDLQLIGFALTKSQDDSCGSKIIPHPWG